MNYAKLDAALSSALDTAPAMPAARAPRRAAARPAASAPLYQVLVEFDPQAADAEAAALAHELSMDAPQAQRRVITANLSADQLETASEHPAIRSLSLSKLLRPKK